MKIPDELTEKIVDWAKESEGRACFMVYSDGSSVGAAAYGINEQIANMIGSAMMNKELTAGLIFMYIDEYANIRTRHEAEQARLN